MVYIIWLTPALVMIAISSAYFYLDAGESNRWIRVLVSAHGFLGALLYIGALVTWVVTNAYRPWAIWPLLLLYLLPVTSIAYSFMRFKGPKLLHATQIANIVCMGYQ